MSTVKDKFLYECQPDYNPETIESIMNNEYIKSVKCLRWIIENKPEMIEMTQVFEPSKYDSAIVGMCLEKCRHGSMSPTILEIIKTHKLYKHRYDTIDDMVDAFKLTVGKPTLDKTVKFKDLVSDNAKMLTSVLKSKTNIPSKYDASIIAASIASDDTDSGELFEAYNKIKPVFTNVDEMVEHSRKLGVSVLDLVHSNKIASVVTSSTNVPSKHDTKIIKDCIDDITGNYSLSVGQMKILKYYNNISPLFDTIDEFIDCYIKTKPGNDKTLNTLLYCWSSVFLLILQKINKPSVHDIAIIKECTSLSSTVHEKYKKQDYKSIIKHYKTRKE